MKMTSRHIRIALYSLLSILLGSAIISSCDSCNPYIAKPAVISSFTSSSSNVNQGTKVTLYFNLKNAKSVKIEADYNGDGTIADSEIDTITDYSERVVNVFITRKLDKLGSLEFKLVAEGKDESETNANVSTNVIAHPLPDLSSLDFTVIEGKTITFELPTVTGVEYTTITIKNDGSKIVSSRLDGSANKFTIQVSDDVTEQGSFDVELGYNIPETGITGTLSKTRNVIENIFKVSGKLECTDNRGNGELGSIKLFDISNGELLGSVNADSNGEFSLQASRVVTAGVMLEATLNRDSYYRKKEYLVGSNGINDISGLIYRVVSAPQFYLDPGTNHIKCTKADFREMLEFATFNGWYNGSKYIEEKGMRKAKIDELKGIEILREYPDDTSYSYSQSIQDKFESFLLDPSGIAACIGGKDFSALIQKDGAGNVPPIGKSNHFEGSGYPKEKNWVIVSPRKINGGATVPIRQYDPYNWTIIVGAVIWTQNYSVDHSPALLNHELLHWMLYSYYEVQEKFRYVSHGYPGTPLEKPGVADIKAGNEVVYEPTYEPGEKSRNLLGLISGYNAEIN
jgi:hypothetical protein